MLYIVCADGSVEELAEATAIASSDGVLVVKDAQGRTVKEYARESVMMFGYTERVKQLAILAAEEERRRREAGL